MNKFKLSAVAIIASLALTACGGGGGNNSNNQKKVRLTRLKQRLLLSHLLI